MTAFYPVSSKLKNYSFCENAFIPKSVVIPLCQEAGSLCKSLVKAGEIVKEGDVIASATKGVNSFKVHSPVPGVVTNIQSVLCPNGRQESAIVIKTGGSFSYLGKNIADTDYSTMSGEYILGKIEENGIVNTFNVAKPVAFSNEIREQSKKKSPVLIVRMFDEDPVRLSDSLLSKMFLEEIRTGSYIAAKALNAEGVLFVFDSSLEKQLADFVPLHPDVKTTVLFVNNSKVPCGRKREICNQYKKAFKKDSQFEIDTKDLFVDCYTVYDVYHAVVKNTPVISRYVHIAGNCIDSSAFLNVRIGTTFRDIIDQLGGWIEVPALVVINGHLSGYSVQTLDTPVTKYVKSLSFISKKYLPDQRMYDCVSCGNCRAACPRQISPDILFAYHYYGKEISEDFKKTVLDCSECSLCNSVCPARIPLSQIIDFMKEKMKKEMEDERN